MSVDISIMGVRDADGKLADMMDLKEQCEKLKIEHPQELKDYFNGNDALSISCSERAIKEATEVSLKYDLKIDGLMVGNAEYEGGVLIDLSKLPEDIKKIRIEMV